MREEIEREPDGDYEVDMRAWQASWILDSR